MLRVHLSYSLLFGQHRNTWGCGWQPTLWKYVVWGLRIPCIVDTGGSKLNYGIGICPTITKSRGRTLAFFDLQCGVHLTAEELLRLQGFQLAQMNTKVCAASQLGSMVQMFWKNWLHRETACKPPSQKTNMFWDVHGSSQSHQFAHGLQLQNNWFP